MIPNTSSIWLGAWCKRSGTEKNQSLDGVQVPGHGGLPWKTTRIVEDGRRSHGDHSTALGQAAP